MREELKRQVETCIDRCSGELTELADTIWNNPNIILKSIRHAGPLPDCLRSTVLMWSGEPGD